ncbi:MAG: hypothetical protein ACYS83_12710, partial [Planctomycetota bacterium]
NVANRFNPVNAVLILYQFILCTCGGQKGRLGLPEISQTTFKSASTLPRFYHDRNLLPLWQP